MSHGHDLKALAQRLRTHRLTAEQAAERMPWARDWPLDRLMTAAADALDRLRAERPGADERARHAFEAGFAARPGDECDGRTQPFRWQFTPGGIAWDRVGEAFAQYLAALHEPTPDPTPKESKS